MGMYVCIGMYGMYSYVFQVNHDVFGLCNSKSHFNRSFKTRIFLEHPLSGLWTVTFTDFRNLFGSRIVKGAAFQVRSSWSLRLLIIMILLIAADAHMEILGI